MLDFGWGALASAAASIAQQQAYSQSQRDLAAYQQAGQDAHKRLLDAYLGSYKAYTCAYCASPHNDKQCPNCGAPA